MKRFFEAVKNGEAVDIVFTKLYNRYINARLKMAGINFSKTEAQIKNFSFQSLNSDALYNHPTSYYSLKKGLDNLPLKNNTICFLDIGCGSGRALNYCMLKGVRHVVGIDLDDSAVQLAEDNCQVLKDNGFDTAFNVYKADAAIFSIPEYINTIYLFNPFGRKTMQTVAERIFDYVKQTGKPVFVIYGIASYKDIFERYSNCQNIYEEFNKGKKRVELVVFKIQ